MSVIETWAVVLREEHTLRGLRESTCT